MTKNENTLKHLSKEYLNDVLVRLAHHSSAIEGNTISLADTVSILLYNTIPGKTNLREFYEVDNHREAFSYIIHSLQNKESLSVHTIKDIHSKLTNKLQHDSGQFKKQGNAILGAEFQTASPQETPLLMQQWVDNLTYQLNIATSEKEILKTVGDFHIQFERIHPFSYGNGQTGRIVMNYSMLQHGLPPLIIEAKDKAVYINILAKQDPQQFVEFATPLIQQEKIRVQQFLNKDKQQKQIENDELEG
jgi:Fic family protein